MNTYHFYSGITPNLIDHIKVITIGLKAYKQPNSNYIYHIMIDDPNYDHYNELFNSLQSPDFHIDIIGSDLINNRLGDNLSAQAMKMSYCKLFACSIFPTIDKVLWLDSDLIILRNGIEQIFDLDSSNNYVAAVIDIPTQFIWNEQLSNTKVKLYFNAGVMLLNLKKIREDGLDKIIQHDALQWPSQIKNVHQDQTIFNYRFKQNVLWVSPVFNNILYSNPPQFLPAFDYIYKQYGFNHPLDAIDHTIVVHWPGGAKPYYDCYQFWKESKEIYYKQKEYLQSLGY